MNKQELIRFLQEEADRALQTIGPSVLKELEDNLVPGLELTVAMDKYLTSYKEPNLRSVIVSRMVKRLEDLDYGAYSKDEEGKVVIVVS